PNTSFLHKDPALFLPQASSSTWSPFFSKALLLIFRARVAFSFHFQALISLSNNKSPLTSHLYSHFFCLTSHFIGNTRKSLSRMLLAAWHICRLAEAFPSLSAF